MPSKLNLSLWHDGKYWIAENGQLKVSARELVDLDQKILESVRELKLFPVGTDLDVYMCFDQTVIPEWIRQYANHYFNRSITLKI